MKSHLVTLAILGALVVPAHAGRDTVAPEGPMFVPLSLSGATSGTAPVGESEVGAFAAQQMSAATSFCAAVPEVEYRIDCLADQLGQLAESIPSTPDFAEARQIVRQASRKLNAVARKHASDSKRPANLRSPVSRDGAPKTSSRPIVPVERSELPAANAEAEVVLTEATTLLLRAAETAERRRIPYQQIAQAVDSTKILLRSS